MIDSVALRTNLRYSTDRPFINWHPVKMWGSNYVEVRCGRKFADGTYVQRKYASPNRRDRTCLRCIVVGG